MYIVSKELHSNKQDNNSINVANLFNYGKN